MFLRGEHSLHTIAAKLFPSSYNIGNNHFHCKAAKLFPSSYDIGNNHFHCKATDSVELINLTACMYVWNGK